MSEPLTEQQMPWAFDDENDDITLHGAPVFKVYREHDFPCIEDDERAAADVEYLAHASVVVMLLNTIATTRVATVGEALTPSPDEALREARDRAETLIDAQEQGMIADRKADYGKRFNGAQEASIRATHRLLLQGVEIMFRAALSTHKDSTNG